MISAYNLTYTSCLEELPGLQVHTQRQVYWHATFMAKNHAVAQSAKRAHKFNSDVDASVEVFKLGAQYWIYVIDRTRYVFFEYLYQKSYDYDNILPCYSSFLSISAIN